MMKTNEIKKALYRQKPQADLLYIRNQKAFYEAQLSNQKIFFEIPVSDMGDADFLPKMDAKLLIRWIQN